MKSEFRPDQEFSLYARKDGNFRLGLKLFGTIPFKEISVNVEDACYAVPCGMPVGNLFKIQGRHGHWNRQSHR